MFLQEEVVVNIEELAMIFDEHEVGDDWNISAAWVEEMRQQPWWNDQIVGGYASYWISQHLGNLSPEELQKDGLYNRIEDADVWAWIEDKATGEFDYLLLGASLLAPDPRRLERTCPGEALLTPSGIERAGA